VGRAALLHARADLVGEPFARGHHGQAALEAGHRDRGRHNQGRHVPAPARARTTGARPGATVKRATADRPGAIVTMEAVHRDAAPRSVHAATSATTLRRHVGRGRSAIYCTAATPFWKRSGPGARFGA
jgi:hypothetical protein